MLSKLNTLLIKCTRSILGFDSYKWNTVKIMNKLKWNTFFHTLIIESICIIHKSIFEQVPISIAELITYSINKEENIRSVIKPMVKINIECS